ncbi:MAG: 5'-nucleotidase C-terminal domain-containing protein [Marinifilum sp.]|jgi:2',3'-cyclic-nucleotide 2'-phosphodiesterase (5'-nucleotidase family)|nr:5'-nucleotidase C-terminal domain-containing protein [Marinifilum sp.]
MERKLIKSLFIVLIAAAFSSCASTSKQSTNKVESHYSINADLDKISAKDTSIINLINSYKHQLDGEMNAIISIAEMDLMTGKPEGLLSNFIADAMFGIGKKYCAENNLEHSIDVVLMNMGGIRTSLSKGEISTGRVYEMLPFKNKLVIVGMKGKDLMNLLHRVAYFGGEGVSGVKMGIKNRKAIDVLVDGKPVDHSKIYHVMSVDYLVNGGGGFTAFEQRETFRHMHKLLRSEIIKYMSERHKKGEKISAKLDGRIYNVE